jgi:hypothetical protein
MVIYRRNKRKDPQVKKINIPERFFDMKEEVNPTRYKMDPVTGRMIGRYANVPPQYSDHIRYLVMKTDADVTGDNIPDLRKGQIIARLPRFIATKPHNVIIKLKLKKGQKLKARARPTMVRGAYRAYKE